MTYKERVVSSELNASNIVLNASNDLNLESTNINAKDNIIAKANNINIVAKTYKEGELHYSKKKGFGGLSSKSSMNKLDSLKLKAAKLTLSKEDLQSSIPNEELRRKLKDKFTQVLGTTTDTTFLNDVQKGIDLNSNKNINIIASNLDSKNKNINLKAQEDVIIASANELQQSEIWTKKQKFSIGNAIASASTLGLADIGPIFELENNEEKILTSTSKASNIIGNNIIIDAGSTTVMGSNIEANNDINVKTDIGSIKILAAQNTQDITKSSKKIKVSMSGITEIVKSLKEQMTSNETQLKVQLGEATYDAIRESLNEVTNTASSLIAKNGNITLDSSEDILIEGSNLASDKGTLSLNTLDGNVTIKEAVDTKDTKKKETHGKAEVSVSVQNEYVQIAVALKNLKASKDSLKEAKRSEKKYKKEVKELQNTLIDLKSQLASNAIGVDIEDIEDLNEIIDDMKSDSSIYKAAIAASVIDLASKTTALVAQIAAAAANSGTYGFTAGITLDINGNKKQTTTNSTTSQASNITTNNLIINTADDNTTSFQGSNIEVTNNASINTGELKLLASQNTYNESMDNKSISGSITLGMGGVSGSLGTGKDNSTTSSLKHNNTQFKVGNSLDLDIKKDMNIKGANVIVQGNTDANIQGDLNIVSLRDINKSTSSSYSIGASGGSGGVSGGSAGVSISKSTNKKVIESTFISNSADITVKGNTHLEGSTLASGTYKDGVLKDNNNLNLKINSITFKNLSNLDYSKSSGLNLGIGTTTTVKANKDMNYTKTKTLASLGNGNITLSNNKDLDERLNRDITNTNKELFSAKEEFKTDVSVDTRLLSEDGRAQIADDMKVSKVGFYDVAKDIITKDSLTILDSFKHQGNKVDMYKGVQNAIKNSKELQGKLSNPNITKEQKNEVLRLIASNVAKELNIKLSDVSTVASNSTTTKDGNKIKGAFHEASGDIAINDTANTSTADTINSLGNEVAHLLDTQRGEKRVGTTSSGQSYKDEYSNVMGDSMEDYANFAMYNYADGKTLSSTNNHNGLTPPKSVFDSNYNIATQKFENRNFNGELEYRQLAPEENLFIKNNAKKYAKAFNVSEKEAKQKLQIASRTLVDTQDNTMINKIIDNPKTNSIMTKNELTQTQEFIMKESLGLTYMDGLENYKVPLMTQTQAKKDNHNYVVNIQDAINPDFVGAGALLKIGNGAIKFSPSVFNSGKTVVNKGINTYDDIGRQTSIYFNSTVKPSINAGVNHNIESVKVVKDLSKEIYNRPNTVRNISFIDDAVNSAFPHGTPSSSYGGALGFGTIQYLDNKEVIQEFFNNQYNLIFKKDEK